MSSKHLLHQLILEEVKKILLEQEAPPDAAFGQYLFAPLRKDTPPEPNTTEEENFLEALWDYVTNERPVHIEKMMPFLLSLKNKGYYSNFLEPAPGEVYRYMTVKRSVAQNILNLSSSEIKEHPNRAWWIDDIGTVDPKGKQIMSWTVNPDASGFDDFVQLNHDNVALLLIANTKNNNFLLNPKAFVEKITKRGTRFRGGINTMLSMLKQEMETISYGPVNVIGASFLYIDVDDVYQRKMQSVEQKADQIKLPNNIAGKVDKAFSDTEKTTTSEDDLDDAVVVIMGRIRNLISENPSIDAMIKHIESVFSPTKPDLDYKSNENILKKLLSLLIREYIQENYASSAVAAEFIKVWKPLETKKSLLKELFFRHGKGTHFRRLPRLYRARVRKALVDAARI